MTFSGILENEEITLTYTLKSAIETSEEATIYIEIRSSRFKAFDIVSESQNPPSAVR